MAAQQTPRASELNQDDWLLLEATVERWEEAWRTQADPQLVRFVPPCAHSMRVRVLVELVKVDQERRWETGDHRFLEDYLAQWPELVGSPDVLAELVEAECLTRAILDHLPTPEELAHRFPAIARRIDLDQLAQKVVPEDFTVRIHSSNARSKETIHIGSADTPVPRMCCGELRVGGRLGRYEIRAILGRGGMGAVYRAYDAQLDREVALKIPRFDPAAEPELLERFIREARVAARIRHPHVCPVYDAGRVEGVPYLTMALIDGGSLEDRVREGVTPPRDAIEMVRKLAAGLEAIHLSGMVHRDIKPSNVLIDRAGEPLLADFGLARPLSGMDVINTSGLFSGTPAYMAPEQVVGGSVDARTDVYSLAVLLHRLITGSVSYPDIPANCLERTDSPAAPSPCAPCAGMDADLAAVCRRALSVDPSARQASAREFADELGKCLQGDAEPLFRRSSVSWPVALVAIVASALCLSGMALTIQSCRPDSQRTRQTAIDGQEVIPPSVPDSRIALQAELTAESLLRSMLSVNWSMPLTHATDTAVSHVQMTPDGTHLLALYNTISSTGSVAKIAARNGELSWQKQIPLEGRAIENGWIDRRGDVFLTSSVEGYAIWKTDTECEYEKGYFRTGPGCEYIGAVITDFSDNVYISGSESSRSGKGSTCAKLTSDLQLIWEVNVKYTEGKDDYSLDMALDSHGNLYRVGCDNPEEDQAQVRGRVIAHRADNGEVRSSFMVDEPSSFVAGVLTDEENCFYFAYSYNAIKGSGVPTGTERTVVEKRDLAGYVLWRREILYTGIVIGRNALRWASDGSLLLVFQITVAGNSYPGLASFSRGGERRWLKIVDRPGWNACRAGAEVAGTTAFLGLTSVSEPGRTEVVAIPLDPP
jgi:serine/threonine protein kinase